ncbi:tetratricopeptide repeat protein [Piscirickettsia litoralis]|uniref:O-GlcNAc transferase C-terminal domain-containing protein n=1 Tax=Piscirickettsia litoralis TaxID=1891921 RepID=A0ABX3A802_9GAMM|nr:hypothetical protein [Piscirickettsia litoralis]ODN43763.1 hypothetical protein BGC07_13730 [Piscirickettsia litoralis]
MGIPSSTGQPYVDYMIQQSSLLREENINKLYSENLILSKKVVLQKPKTNSNLEAQGLPDGNLYMLHHYHFKVHPDMDEIIKEIILLDSNSRIIIGYMPTYSTLQCIQHRLFKTLGQQRYTNHIYTLKEQNMNQLLSIIKKADVALDTFYFGMGTTALECIYNNLPIVTYPSLSRTHISRVVQEIYIRLDSQLIKEHCIAESKNDYIYKTTQLATNKQLNNKIKTEIKENIDKIDQDQKIDSNSLAEILYSISHET